MCCQTTFHVSMTFRDKSCDARDTLPLLFVFTSSSPTGNADVVPPPFSAYANSRASFTIRSLFYFIETSNVVIRM